MASNQVFNLPDFFVKAYYNYSKSLTLYRDFLSYQNKINEKDKIGVHA
jgi:hypothetical protein